MKKAYVTPEIEKVEFQYRDQVVAASGKCNPIYKNEDTDNDRVCDLGDKTLVEYAQ